MNVESILKWLDVVFEPIVLLVIAVAGYFWGIKSWRTQKKEEGRYIVEQKKYEARLEAYKQVWSLIVFFSENDSDLNMLRRGETGSDGVKAIYFRKAQAKQFFDTLQTRFFNDGHGLFLSSDIKELLYELRSLMYGLYHNAEKGNLDEMKIQKKELINRVIKIREDLIRLLHNEIDNNV